VCRLSRNGSLCVASRLIKPVSRIKCFVKAFAFFPSSVRLELKTMSYLRGGLQNYDASLAQTGASTNPQHYRRRSSDRPGVRRPNIGLLDRPKTADATKAHDVGPVPQLLSGREFDAEEEARREEEVHGLAKEMTRKSTFSESGLNPLEAGPDSKLNPNSRNFSAKAWAKALLNLREQDPEQNPMRTAGVAFRNLNVYGFGTSSDYQRTVGNAILRVVGMFRRLAGTGQRRIDILQNFEGIVRAGEMLVVLGPPGSGCTTFLKTISGETHGFHVDKDSYLNYQGKSMLPILH
jgi:ATP-binding cassette, subfamily G (WHITE), member 2, PDR